MITVLRAYGLRVVIYRHDHEPPHVHIIGDGEVKIALAGPDGRPRVLQVTRMHDGDVRKALRAVVENRTMLLDLWRKIHG